MDIERATELCHRLTDKLSDEVLALVYDTDAWDREGDVPLHEGVTEEDAERITNAEMYLSHTTIDPGTTYTVLDGGREEPTEREWVDPDTGKPVGYMPSMAMTEALARARKNLLAVADAPPALWREVHETLDLVDEALAALDLTPQSPLVKLAAED